MALTNSMALADKFIALIADVSDGSEDRLKEFLQETTFPASSGFNRAYSSSIPVSDTNYSHVNAIQDFVLYVGPKLIEQDMLHTAVDRVMKASSDTSENMFMREASLALDKALLAYEIVHRPATAEAHFSAGGFVFDLFKQQLNKGAIADYLLTGKIIIEIDRLKNAMLHLQITFFQQQQKKTAGQSIDGLTRDMLHILARVLTDEGNLQKWQLGSLFHAASDPRAKVTDPTVLGEIFNAIYYPVTVTYPFMLALDADSAAPNPLAVGTIYFKRSLEPSDQLTFHWSLGGNTYAKTIETDSLSPVSVARLAGADAFTISYIVQEVIAQHVDSRVEAVYQIVHGIEGGWRHSAENVELFQLLASQLVDYSGKSAVEKQAAAETVIVYCASRIASQVSKPLEEINNKIAETFYGKGMGIVSTPSLSDGLKGQITEAVQQLLPLLSERVVNAA